MSTERTRHPAIPGTVAPQRWLRRLIALATELSSTALTLTKQSGVLYCEKVRHLTFSVEMATTEDLHNAKLAKKDEFYTQLDDIAEELKHYRKHFVGKVVLCNCDDPYESNFAKYFLLNFNELGLKKLICTSYNGSTITEMELPLIFEEPHPRRKKGRSQVAYLLKVSKVRDITGDGAVGLNDVKQLLKKHPPKLLEGNGDFRSPECVKLLKEADIVVTNPPFSLFREYVAQLMEYGKKFLIIGNQNAVTYKEIFPLLKENKMWFGPSISSGDRKFNVPDDYELNASICGVDEDGRKYIRVKGVRWFTNMDHEKRHEELDLYKRYTAKEYPKYDNYDAIEVSKTVEIPYNYDGVMGVPITFLDKYCPEQFEIVGMAKRGAGDPALKSKVYTKEDYPNYSDLNAGPVLRDENGKLYNTYPRILIRRK